MYEWMSVHTLPSIQSTELAFNKTELRSPADSMQVNGQTKDRSKVH